jgi:hypothetical protein
MQGGTSYEPIAAQSSEYDVAVDDSPTGSNLYNCAVHNVPITLQSNFNVNGTPVVISPTECQSFLALDPFAATATGLVSTPAGQSPGQAVDPTTVIAPGVNPGPLTKFGGGNIGSPTPSNPNYDWQTASTTSLTYDSSSTFDAQVTDISKNEVAVSAGVTIPIDIFSVGAGVTFDYSQSNSRTHDVSLTYDKSDTTTTTLTSDTNVSFQDDGNPIGTNIFMDTRFGTLMFQVPRPALGSIAPTSGAAGSSVTVTGAGTPPSGGFSDSAVGVQFCPINGAACKNGTLVTASGVFNGDGQITVSAPSFSAGTVTTVRVQTAGGSSANSLTYTFASPGTSIKLSGPALPRPGDVMIVSGQGFQPGEVVQVSLTGSTGPSAPSGLPMAAPTADSHGGIQASVVVPAEPKGSYYVVAAGQTTAAGNAAPLAIHRLLVLQQGKGASGQTVVANVLGSVPGGGVALHWDKANGPVMATSTGSAAGSAVMAFKVPAAAIGNHTVYATSAGAVMTALFTVTSTNVPPPAPQGGSTPGSGVPGSVVVVSGTGFPAGSPVRVIDTGTGVLLDLPLASPLGTVQVPIVVPAAPGGPHAVVLTGTQGGLALDVFTVNHRLVITPASAARGATATASVFGFVPFGDPIQLHLGSTTGPVLLPGTIQTDSLGSVTSVFTIPTTAKPGAQSIWAVDNRGFSVGAAFKVT